MRKKKHGSSDDEASIDMTPMLDIVFIMLIFFIVTTSFTKEQGLDVLRPKETNQPPPETPSKSLAIRIDENGGIVLNGDVVDIRRITARVQFFLSENISDSAAIQAHEKTKHGVVVEVMNQVKEAGIPKVSVLVKK